MGRGRMVPVVVLAMVASGALAGCGADGRVQPLQSAEERSVACSSWVELRTDAERSAAADLVIDAEVTGTRRTVDSGGGVYDLHEATVTSIAKGDDAAVPGDTIPVISTSDQCITTGEPVEYAGDDVLAGHGTFRLYLTKADPADDDSVWQLIVPGAAERISG